MSSWLISLQRYGLGSSGIADDIRCVGPGRLIAETRAQIIEQCGDLVVAHAFGKARHDRAALVRGGTKARQYDVGGVAGIRAGEGGTEREVDSTERRRTVGGVAWRAGGDIEL